MQWRGEVWKWKVEDARVRARVGAIVGPIVRLIKPIDR